VQLNEQISEVFRKVDHFGGQGTKR
jgi:hypothetical protein